MGGSGRRCCCCCPAGIVDVLVALLGQQAALHERVERRDLGRSVRHALPRARKESLDELLLLLLAAAAARARARAAIQRLVDLEHAARNELLRSASVSTPACVRHPRPRTSEPAIMRMGDARASRICTAVAEWCSIDCVTTAPPRVSEHDKRARTCTCLRAGVL